MGEVYLAHDPRLDRRVAIKLLPADTAADPRSRERLRREAIAVAANDHPYICKIFELGEEGDALFLVMEYVTGQTLHDRLQAGRLPLADALRLGGEIAEALHEAHSRRFLHRDLKPANVMLTDHGHVKVMDFGLAKRVEEPRSADELTSDATTAQLTAQGGIIGTPDYMSPEQVKAGKLDPRSDLFSFGVMLAEMITGTHPFRSASLAETLSAVLREEPNLADASPGVSGVLRRLLEKYPENRYASAAQVRDDLARLMSSPQALVASPTVAYPATSAPAVPWTRRWRVLGALTIVLALSGYALVRRITGYPGSAGAIRSIAVLPLENHSGDSAQDYFAEGMTDEVTADLATISELRVISRGSAMQFSGSNRPATPEIARRLNVDAVVEGSVSRSGDTVRIAAQLIDAREDRLLWARHFERDSRDVLALQADLASAIASEIKVRLTPGEQTRLARTVAVNPEAHDAYLKGRFFFNRPSDENLQRAIAQFEEAVRLSPDFSLAYSGLSDAYLWAGYNEGFITAAGAKPKAKEAAERAVELDDNSAEAHSSLGTFRLFYGYDWEGCEREFRRAFALNPNYAFAHDQFGMALAFQGRYEEAIAESARAIEIDPLSPQILVDATMPFLFQRKTGEAKALARRATELDPTFFFPVMVGGWADLETGQFREALPALQKAKTMDAPPFVTAYLAFAHGAAGDRAGALAALADLKKMSSDGTVLPFNLALVKLGLGDHAGALDGLEQAYAANSQMMPWIGRDRMFDPLRSEPRFAALLRQVNLAR